MSFQLVQVLTILLLYPQSELERKEDMSVSNMIAVSLLLVKSKYFTHALK